MKTTLAFLSLTLLLATPAVRAGNDYPLKTCIVTGDALGGDLGAPVEVNYNGRKILLCCKSCVKKFNKEPQKYLNILDDAVAKAK